MSTYHARNPYVTAGPGDSRSPCPALNALANHSYIPHSGRSIPYMQLVQALRMIYNCSYPMALVLSTVGFLWCGHLTGSGFSTRLALDLHDLAYHGRIEHDGSLSHADVNSGKLHAPTVTDPQRLSELLNAGSANAKGPGGVEALTLFDLSRVRYLRDAALSQPLNTAHTLIARGEIALIILAMGISNGESPEENVVPRERLVQWVSEERLPDGWAAPSTQIGLRNTTAIVQNVQSEVARLARFS